MTQRNPDFDPTRIALAAVLTWSVWKLLNVTLGHHIDKRFGANPPGA